MTTFAFTPVLVLPLKELLLMIKKVCIVFNKPWIRDFVYVWQLGENQSESQNSKFEGYLRKWNFYFLLVTYSQTLYLEKYRKTSKWPLIFAKTPYIPF